MIDNGGYVYPQPTVKYDSHGKPLHMPEGGKTLLDDFAGQAMQVLLRDEWTDAITEMAKDMKVSNNAVRAECSYDIAVAMIKEKRKRES